MQPAVKIGQESFAERAGRLRENHEELVSRPNVLDASYDTGFLNRYKNPVLTAAHVPLEWRIDFDRLRNPFCMERLGVNAVFNAGAIFHEERHVLVARVEGYDRKSFFAVAESRTGIDQFRFCGEPLHIAEKGQRGQTLLSGNQRFRRTGSVSQQFLTVSLFLLLHLF